MVKRLPDDGPAEIKWGAQLTVRESQEAIFFRDGKTVDVFTAGRYTLKTNNVPLVGKWVTSFAYGPDSPFRAEVYFVSKKLFANLKWGTREPILFRDSELKMVRVRAFGIFSIQISDSSLFLNKVAGTAGLYTADGIEDYLKGIVLSNLATALGKELRSVFDIGTSYDKIGAEARAQLNSQFTDLGLLLHDFNINSINLPEEVQAMIDTRSGLSAIGNMDDFMKYKVAMSLEKAADNPSSGMGGMMGNMIGAGTGLGMGYMMPQYVQQAMSVSAAPAAPKQSAVERIKSLKELLDIGALSQEEFDTKKKQLLEEI
jgi:membrane protease subunit (stomatin/prohibitin family)